MKTDNKMSREEIAIWCENHIKMKSRILEGYGLNYMLIFENGDKYEYKEKEVGYDEKIVEILINGDLVNTTHFEFHDFGWYAIA